MRSPVRRTFRHLRGDLIDERNAAELAQLFKVLANPNRLRILHAIYLAGELSPLDVAEGISSSQQAVSNHLQRLADLRIVDSRRDGQRVLYRVVDPCVPGLMDLGVCLVAERSARSDRTDSTL